MQTTGNLGLKKPEGTDVVNIDDINSNMDKLDGEVVKKASSSVDGRMSKEDKSKLDGVANNANNYVHPSTHSMDLITETTTKKIMTSAERSKLSGIATSANKYVHPSSHSASIITQDSTHRFVTDTEKSNWNGKAASSHTHDSRYYTESEIDTKLITINEQLNSYSSYASGKDSNGIYTVMDYKRSDNTIYMKSTLSGGTSPKYTTDTWKYYANNGTTIVKTITWTLSYDSDGNIISKVVG